MNKNTILSTTLFAALLLANTTGAEAKSHALDVKVKFVKTNAKKLRVMTNEINKNNLEVSLRNEAGDILYSGNLSVSQLESKQFDLTALPDGTYSLTVNGQAFYSTQRVKIQNGNLSIEADTYEEVLKPTLNVYGVNRLEVAGINAGTYISIRDAYGEEVYHAMAGNSRRFDLSKLASGAYTFEFALDNKQFTETVNVVK